MTALQYTSGTAIRVRMSGGTADQTIYDSIGTAVNELLEGYIGAPVGPAGTATRLYDGDGRDVLWIRQGVQSITTLEIADQTGGSYTSIGTAYYRLRPADHDRPTGWPAWKVRLTESAPMPFTDGYDTVRVAGVYGWAAIPPELSQVAVIIGTRMFQARKSGESMAVGETDTGALIFRFLPETEYRHILERFRNVVSPALSG